MDEQTFKKLFPVMSNQELAQQNDMSIRSVIRRTRSLGLEKDQEYLQSVGKKNLSHTVAAKGEQHYNWKGGKPWKRFKDERYQTWRNAVLERDKYICQDCGRQCKKHEKGLAAHHLKPYAQFPDLRYEVSNGQTLCRQCHMKLHGKEYEIEMIPCACGCGTMIPSKDRYGRDRQYVNHHGGKCPRSTKKYPRDDGTKIPCACGCGTVINRIGARGTPISYLHGHGRRKKNK